MGKLSISFALLVLILAAFAGSVAGSLLDRVFGLELIHRDLFNGPITLAEDFYLIAELSVRITPGVLIGLGIAGWLLYRKGKN